jgi:hypothetical protein
MDDQRTDREGGGSLNRSGESFLESLVFLALAIIIPLAIGIWLVVGGNRVFQILGFIVICGMLAFLLAVCVKLFRA